MNQQRGIVLKKQVTHGGMITVFDIHLGKIRCVPDKLELCFGDLLAYSVIHKRQFITIATLERVALPLALAQTELLFFHHVLELCNYFILPGMRMPKIFALLEMLYFIPVERVTVTFKKCFLTQFFVELGMYPEGFLSTQPSFCAILVLPLDSIDNEAMLNDIDEALSNWLRICVLEHPQMRDFNTIHFLTGYGVL